VCDTHIITHVGDVDNGMSMGILGRLYTHHLYNGLENVGARAFKAITLEMP